jgi:hypothetical protein
LLPRPTTRFSSVRSMPVSSKRPQIKSEKNSFDAATNAMGSLIVADDDADVDAGYPDSEKVTVVFLVRRLLVWIPQADVRSANKYPIIRLLVRLTIVVRKRESKRTEWIRSLQRFRACVSTLLTLRITLSTAAVRVAPGPECKGIFVRINRDGPGKGEVTRQAADGFRR